MGDPQTLKDFLVYCADNYMGKKNMLIMWDHGSGWLDQERSLIIKQSVQMIYLQTI